MIELIQLPHTMVTYENSSVLYDIVFTNQNNSIENNTTQTTAITLTLVRSTGISVLIALLMSVLTLGCILGNGLVILAVLQVQKLKTASNYLIVSLAVSDILVGLIAMPLAIPSELFGKWPLGSEVCGMWVTFDVMLCTASILNLMMISIDRYLVITRPFQYTQKRTTKLILLYIAIAWIVSLLISVTPLMVGWKTEYKDGLCMINDDLGYQIYATLGAFYLPLGVMIALYGRIFLISSRIAKAEAKNNPSRITEYPAVLEETELTINNNRDVTVETELDNLTKDELNKPLNGTNGHRQSNGSTNHSSGHRNNSMVSYNHRVKKSISDLYNRITLHHKDKRRSAHNSQAIKTLGIIMGLFTACWLPFFILAVVRSVLTVTHTEDIVVIPHWVTSLLTWLGWANSCLNPLIYARFNREFRTPFKEILCCRCRSINQSVRYTDYLYRFGS